ncbi:MAG: ABC transporter substrate-binding protein [Chloroflexota bacterium]
METRLTRSQFIRVFAAGPLLALAACSPAATPAPTSAPAKAEPPKPAATAAPAAPAAPPAATTAPAKPEAAKPAEQKPAESKPAGDPIPLRFASIANASQSYIPVVMIEKGIGKKYGFDVKMVDLSNTAQQWTSMRGGESDVSSGSFLDLLRQRQAGLKAKAFRGFYGFGNPIVAPANKTYAKLTDLKGAKVGVPSANLLDWQILRAAGKKKDGFDIGKEATVQEAAPQILMQTMLRGELDASYQFSDFVLEGLTEGKLKEVTTVAKVMAEGGLDTKALYLTYNMVDSWREKHGPDAVARLIAAMDEAVEVMQKDDSLWAMLAKRSGVENQKLIEPFMKLQRERFNVDFGKSKLEPTQTLLDEMVKTVGQEPVGVSKVDPEAFDFDSVEAAKKARR